MRIAYVCADPGVPVFGQKGCSIHVQELTRAFIRQGADVHLFSPQVQGALPPGLEHLHVHKLSCSKTGDPAEREQSSIKMNGDLDLALKTHGPFDLVYERYSLWSYAGMEYARNHTVPGILEVNAPLIEEQTRHRQLIDRDTALNIATRVFRATALVAVSEEVGSYLEQNWEVQDRVHVIPNGIDPNRFEVTAPLSFPASRDTFNIGFVGTLKPWHGVENLIEAFALFFRMHPDSKLQIIGDGPKRKSLEEQASIYNLCSSVVWHGAVSPDRIPSLLASMDVAVAPYPDLSEFYFSPLKVFEYMAAGLPIVASDIGQIKQIIQNEVHGLLCTPGDPVALVLALEKLYRSPEIGIRLGHAARDKVFKNHTWDGVARRIFEIVNGPSVAASPDKRVCNE